MIDFTTLVAVDEAHLPELRVAWPTWYRNFHQLATRNLVIVCDTADVLDQLEFIEIDFEALLVDEVLPTSFPRQVSQRERMLSSLVHAARDIPTEYFLKLDTDTLAPRGGVFYDDGWFVDRPAIVAPRWGYTKPGHWLTTLDRWGDQVMPDHSAPDWKLDGGVAKSSRIISYAMYGRTDFGRRILEHLGPTGQLPVPSQDTLSWYAAARWGEPVVRLRPAQHRWIHCGGRINQMIEIARDSA